MIHTYVLSASKTPGTNIALAICLRQMLITSNVLDFDVFENSHPKWLENLIPTF